MKERRINKSGFTPAASEDRRQLASQKSVSVTLSENSARQAKQYTSLEASSRQLALRSKSKTLQSSQEELMQRKFKTAQRVEEDELLQGKVKTAQRVEEDELLQGNSKQLSVFKTKNYCQVSKITPAYLITSSLALKLFQGYLWMKYGCTIIPQSQLS